MVRGCVIDRIYIYEVSIHYLYPPVSRHFFILIILTKYRSNLLFEVVGRVYL